jgi:hypothetical protein
MVKIEDISQGVIRYCQENTLECLNYWDHQKKGGKDIQILKHTYGFGGSKYGNVYLFAVVGAWAQTDFHRRMVVVVARVTNEAALEIEYSTVGDDFFRFVGPAMISYIASEPAPESSLERYTETNI